jgi:hypothetical protein
MGLFFREMDERDGGRVSGGEGGDELMASFREILSLFSDSWFLASSLIPVLLDRLKAPHRPPNLPTLRTLLGLEGSVCKIVFFLGGVGGPSPFTEGGELGEQTRGGARIGAVFQIWSITLDRMKAHRVIVVRKRCKQYPLKSIFRSQCNKMKQRVHTMNIKGVRSHSRK